MNVSTPVILTGRMKSLRIKSSSDRYTTSLTSTAHQSKSKLKLPTGLTQCVKRVLRVVLFGSLSNRMTSRNEKERMRKKGGGKHESKDVRVG